MLLKKISNKIILFFASLLFCITSLASDSTPITIKVAVRKQFAEEYQKFTIKQHRAPIELSYNQMKGKSRVFISLVILEQALHIAGLAANIELIISPNEKRSQEMVRNGNAFLTLRHFTDNLTPKDIIRSSALIGVKDQVRGIYGLKSNHALMKVKTYEELSKFSAVTHSGWLADINALQEISPSSLNLVGSFESMFHLIAYRNIDFTLLGLRNQGDNVKRFDEITLVPVPGLLIHINGSYHFLISKKHLNSQTVYLALEKGLAIMREQGSLKKYYQHLTQHGPDFQHWKIINRD